MRLGFVDDALEARTLGVGGLGVEPGQGVVNLSDQAGGYRTAGHFIGLRDLRLADQREYVSRHPNRRGRRVFNGV